MATNAATLFLDIDSSMALDAAKKLQQLGVSADKAGREADRLAAKFDKNYTTTKKLTQEYKDLDTAFNVGYLSAQQYAAGVQQVDAALGAMKTGGAQAVNSLHAVDKAMGSSTHHSTNLMFQLQDIGMMMAAGQNPFMLMMQQGSQVAGIFGQMEAEGKKIGPTIAGAFTQLLNPMTAVTFAVIGGSAALVQWVTSATGAGSEADAYKDSLDGLSSSANRLMTAMEQASTPFADLIYQYGTLAGAARDALQAQVQLEQFNLEQSLKNAAASMDGLASSVAGAVAQIDMFRGVGGELERLELADAIGFIGDEFGLTEISARELLGTLDQLSAARTMDDMAAAAQRFTNFIIDAEGNGAKLPPILLDAAREVGGINLQMLDLIAYLSTASGINPLGGISVGAGSLSMDDERGSQRYEGLSVQGERGRAAAELAAEAAKKGRGGGGKSEAERLRDEMKDRLETLQKGFMAESALEMQQYALDQETLKWALDQRMITLAEYKDREAQLRTMTWGTETEMANLQYQLELQGLNAALEQKYLTQAAYNERVRALEQEHQDRMRGLQNWSWQENLNGMASVFGAMAELQGGNNEKMLRAQRTFAAASALINAYEAGSQVLRDPTLPWFAKIGAAGSIIAAGLGMVSAIKGGGAGGSSSTSRAAAAAPAPAQQKAEPVKNVLVKLEGDAMFMDMAENIMQQIYRQSENGRVIIARG